MLMGKKHPAVYVYDINPQWSQVILCNNEKKDNIISAPLSGVQHETGSLGMQKDKDYYVYDFWNNRLVGTISGNETLDVTLKKYQYHDWVQNMSQENHK